MGRKKVELAYITCNSKRRETFRKRKSGIMKKVNEISILCGIEACAIIYDENDPQAEVWPSDSGVKSVLSRLGSYTELERSKKMVDQEAFLRQSITKAYEQLKKQREETRRSEMAKIINRYIHNGEFNTNLMRKPDFNDLSSFIDENLKEINRKMKGMQIEAKEEVGNGVEVNGTGEQENTSLVQGLGMETNMGDDMQFNFQNWPMDLSMLQFSDVNDDQNNF